MKETYERTDLKVTQFETEDVIITSGIEGTPVVNPGKNDTPFMPNSGAGTRGGLYI